MHSRRRFVVVFGLALSALVTSGGCFRSLSKGPVGRGAVVAYKVERLTLVSDAGQRCEVDAVTYAMIKPGTVFHCNWGGSNPAVTSVTTEAPKTIGDPSGPDIASPWWWPFSFKKGTGPTKAKPSKKAG